MIQYTLTCDAHHKFDAWFRNADAYEDQAARGILTCPMCNSTKIEKALMAPAVSPSRDKVSLSSGHPEQSKYREALRALRQKMTESADYVGDKFAEEARKIHYEEAEARGIYGEATRDEVSSLIDEGIDFMPLPPVPDEHN
ncbi:DUF1178 family protein [Pelagibacterium luteolum]|uniref:DUF1178 family protein n=1 Tax=Pelagibacterium luteolum TaxID=440168 RepID=A0A1G7RNE8_9HYPH|nr:DUF1178 family protein [Pelagibacterium luteolum]SDG12338.1 hypothetical protein SAMN04487974_10118 [Pelagibacterium luteolum]